MNRKGLFFAILLGLCFEPRLGTAPYIQGPLQAEPPIRIGLDQDATAITVRSTQEFVVQKQTTRSAKFSTILAVNENASSAVVTKNELLYRMVVELDGGRMLVLPISTRIRIQPSPSTPPIQIGDRTYRGSIEVFGNSRNTLTVVNELPLELYLLGVVPNELSPSTFGQLEALKAQAVAARTYAVRNFGQYRRENYDICDTDSCQVYFGAGTEHPLATRAVEETKGMIASYDGKPINALYSSTCGGRTESSENIFDEKLPYLVSTVCEFKHPEPRQFVSSRTVADYKQAVLLVAGVSNFDELGRFMGVPGVGEPSSMEPARLAAFLREKLFPNVKPISDLDFMVEQGILSGRESLPQSEILFRLIDKKGVFEWQQGVLTAWDGQTIKLTVNNQPLDFRIASDAILFSRSGDERSAVKEGAWIGGELFDFRAVDGVIQMAVYRRNFVNPSADRYSRLAMWQVHKTRQEIETAFRPLNLGEIQRVRVLERGLSERPIRTEIVGTRGSTVVRALRLRTLLGLRDSLFHFDEERNAKNQLLGMTFYGRGWGHGVGMCQVGAFGMAMDGATYDQILKKYYQGIELRKTY